MPETPKVPPVAAVHLTPAMLRVTIVAVETQANRLRGVAVSARWEANRTRAARDAGLLGFVADRLREAIPS